MTGRNMDDDVEGEDGRGSDETGAVKPVQITGPTVLLLHVFHYLYCRLYKLTLPAQAQVTLQLSLSDLT
jgi:hypothetical protein